MSWLDRLLGSRTAEAQQEAQQQRAAAHALYMLAGQDAERAAKEARLDVAEARSTRAHLAQSMRPQSIPDTEDRQR